MFRSDWIRTCDLVLPKQWIFKLIAFIKVKCQKNILKKVKIWFLIIFSSLNIFIIENIKSDGFDFNEFFERKKIQNKCMADENNRLIYGRNRNKFCNCYVDKYMDNSIPLIASLECHRDILEKIESLSN